MAFREVEHECPNLILCEKLGTSDASCICMDVNPPKSKTPHPDIAYLDQISFRLYQMQQCLQSIVLLLHQERHSSSGNNVP